MKYEYEVAMYGKDAPFLVCCKDLSAAKEKFYSEVRRGKWQRVDILKVHYAEGYHFRDYVAVYQTTHLDQIEYDELL